MAGSQSPKARRWPDLAAVGAIVALYAAMVLLVSPFYEAAANDEILYAGGVKYFLETGQLKISGVSGGATMLAQTLWGALFAWLGGGFSFGALHLASLILSFVASVALYSLCREIGIGRIRSFLGAAVFAFNPITFNLSYVFMVEVPLVAFSTLAALFYLRGIKREGLLDLLFGSLFTFIAFWIRPQAALIPVALFLFYLFNWKRQRPRMRDIAVAIALPLAVSFISYYLYIRQFGSPPMLNTLAEISRHYWADDTLNTLKTAIRTGFFITEYLGLFILPLAAGLLISRRNPFPVKGRVLYVLLALWTVLLGYEVLNLNSYGVSMPYASDTLTLNGLGPSLRILWGLRPAFIVPLDWGWKVITLASTLGGIYMGVVLSSKVLKLRAFLSSPVGFIGLLAVLQLVATLIPFRFVDRFLLALLPLVLVLLLDALRRLPIFVPATLAVLVLFAAYDVAGTQDYIGWNQTAWATAERLVAQGISPLQIDGGLDYEYWTKMSYAEEIPEIYEETLKLNYLDKKEPQLLPWLTSNGIGGRKMFPTIFGPLGFDADAEYVISFLPLSGYDPLREPWALEALNQVPYFGNYKGAFEVVETVEYPSYWGNKGYLYVLRRRAEGT